MLNLSALDAQPRTSDSENVALPGEKKIYKKIYLNETIIVNSNLK